MAKEFQPGGKKGKLHRELGVPTSKTIPADRLRAATHSANPTIKRDAVRAETMKGWHHGGPTPIPPAGSKRGR